MSEFFIDLLKQYFTFNEYSNLDRLYETFNGSHTVICATAVAQLFIDYWLELWGQTDRERQTRRGVNLRKLSSGPPTKNASCLILHDK